jgi:hypothetical protein
MKQLASLSSPVLPALVATAGAQAGRRYPRSPRREFTKQLRIAGVAV